MPLMKFFKIILFFWMFFLPSMAYAQKVFEFRNFPRTLKYIGEVAYLIDTTFKINSSQIDKLSNLPISEKVIPDLGWGKFRGWIKLNAKSSKSQQLFLQIHNPVFDEINVYFFKKGKMISGLQTIRKGTLLRPNSFRLLTVPLVLEKDSVYQIYVSGISKFNPVKFPIRFLDQQGLDEFRDSENLYNGLMLGFMVVLIILNILIFTFFKVRVFLVFSLSNVSFLFLYLYLEGYLFGHEYSAFFFENSYFNFQYLIYYSFQLFNFYFVWSIYRLYFLNKSAWIMTYNMLISVCLIQGFLMFLSPLWESYLSHNQVVGIGLFTRSAALLLNIFMLVLILKTWREKPFSAWMFIAILPGWLSYVIPRFASVFLHDSWVTLPFLYSVSSIWNVLFISIGLFLELSKNYRSKIEQELEAQVEVFEEPISQPKSQYVSQLSKRETEILKAFANGFSYQEISDAMFISPHTVRTHIKNIYNKLEINSKAEAVRWVIEHL
jgi:DNA-binding CsgD family transcriptional regulator